MLPVWMPASTRARTNSMLVLFLESAIKGSGSWGTEIGFILDEETDHFRIRVL